MAEKQTVNACLEDLARVVEDLRWAHATGYGKAGRGLDAERGAALPPLEDEDPDKVPGPTFALDVGDHDCRVAYQRTVSRLARVEADTDSVLDELGVKPLPVRLNPSPVAPLATVLLCASGIRWRLLTLRDMDVTDAQRRRLRPKVKHVRTLLDTSVRNLSKALSKGKAVEATGEKRCGTCEIRPRRDRGKECETCHKWRQRNKQPRPKSLDKDVVELAQQAKARREARGEGWGAA